MGDRVCLLHVSGPDGGGKAISGTVRAVNDLLDSLKRNNTDHGSENFLAGDGHFVLHIGEDGRLNEVAAVPDASAAANELRAFGAAGIDVAHHPVKLGLIDLRALFGGRIEGIADAAFLGAGGAFLDELIVDLLLNENARPGAAALTVIKEEAEVGSFDRFVDIRIGEHDVGALAAELESDALQVRFRGGFHNEVADFGGTGEGDFIDIHVAGERAAGGGTKAREEIDDAFRKSRFDNELTDAEGGERRLLGRLHHDGVAGCQRGGELPGLHQQGKVPWNDLPDDANGLVARVAEVIVADRNGFAVDFIGPAGEVAVAINGCGYVNGLCDLDGLAVIERFQLGEFVGMFFHEVGQFVKEAATFGGGNFAPGAALESVAGGFDGEIDVSGVGLRHLADFFAGGRIEGGEGAAGEGVSPFVVDKKLCCGDGNAKLAGRTHYAGHG